MTGSRSARLGAASDASAVTLQKLSSARVIPVVVLDDPEHAEPLAHALASGGISSVEITLRTPAGLETIRRIAGTGRQLVGAGSVMTAEQVDLSIDAGASFIVSPGISAEVLERSLERGVAVLPGVATPTELQAAAAMGLVAVKLFPADLLGGLRMVDALHGPFPAMRFMPSGGVSADNASDYLAHDAVFAVGGSWMVPRSTIAAGDFDTIEQLSAEAMQKLSTVVCR